MCSCNLFNLLLVVEHSNNLNAVICNLTEHLHSPSSQRCQHMCMCWNSTCSWIVTWFTYRRRSLAFCSVAAHCPGSSPPTPSPSLFPLFQQCDWCLFLLLHGGSWLGYQDLPAMGAVFIQELVANRRSSWMSQVPNSILAMQLLIKVIAIVRNFQENSLASSL